MLSFSCHGRGEGSNLVRGNNLKLRSVVIEKGGRSPLRILMILTCGVGRVLTSNDCMSTLRILYGLLFLIMEYCSKTLPGNPALPGDSPWLDRAQCSEPGVR